ncbi:unnamed protein product, partial [Staurois parvus]
MIPYCHELSVCPCLIGVTTMKLIQLCLMHLGPQYTH